jgi:hypothetical protein
MTVSFHNASQERRQPGLGLALLLQGSPAYLTLSFWLIAFGFVAETVRGTLTSGVFT